MTAPICSELAQPAGGKLRSGNPRTGGVFGFCVHTSGSGIVEEAIKRGLDPLTHAAEYYQRPDSYFAHYLIGWDGVILQICGEEIRAPHVGFGERGAFLDGSWATKVSLTTLQQWRGAWPAYPSPAALMPGDQPSPNNLYVGAEMIPIDDEGRAAPAFPGARYTLAQHQAVVLLANDIARRWAFPAGWPLGPRLVGHEDLNPLTRSQGAGGWDPGALRVAPWFAMRWIRKLCSGVDPGPISPS